MTGNHVTYIKISNGTKKHQQLLNFNHIILLHLFLLINSTKSFLDFILAKLLVRYHPLLVSALLPSQKFVLHIDLMSPSPLVVILSTLSSQHLAYSQSYYLWEGRNSSTSKALQTITNQPVTSQTVCR